MSSTHRFSRPQTNKEQSSNRIDQLEKSKEEFLNKCIENSSLIPRSLNLFLEYMHFYKVPYRLRCQEYDSYNTGEISIVEFSAALNHDLYKLSLNQIEDITRLAPLSVDKKVKYSTFLIFMLKIGKPLSLYSVANMLEFRKNELFENDYNTIVCENYF